MKTLLTLLVAVLTTGCTSPLHTLPVDAERIQIRTDAGFNASKCFWLGDVTGSEGYWFSSWLFPNDVLIRGAINELKTHAYRLGGDTITLDYSNAFSTSVSMLGSVYLCSSSIKNIQ